MAKKTADPEPQATPATLAKDNKAVVDALEYLVERGDTRQGRVEAAKIIKDALGIVE